jgi:hypothetical protein
MFDPNSFKRAVKEWIRENPNGTEIDLQDFCEEQIPPQQFAANEWLVEHTLSWYRHILAHREVAKRYENDEFAA